MSETTVPWVLKKKKVFALKSEFLLFGLQGLQNVAAIGACISHCNKATDYFQFLHSKLQYDRQKLTRLWSVLPRNEHS